MTARLRRSEDTGATLVEFAFVFPVLALLFAGLIDLGFMVLGSSVASNAAREGARVGIIHFHDADDPDSDAFARIDAAVQDKLVGLVKPGTGAFVTVRCLDGDALGTTKPCDDGIDVDHDVIEVVVSWEGIAGTGLLPIDRTRTSSARMVITGGAGDPAGGGPVVPGGSEVYFSPLAYTTTETDALSTVTLTVARTDATAAGSVKVTTVAGTAQAGQDFVALTSQVNFGPGESTKSFAVEILGDDIAEPTESFTVVLSDPIGFTIRTGGGSATVTITDDDAPPATCTTATLQASPVRVDVNVSSQKVHDAKTFSVAFTGPSCTNPTAQVIGGSAGTFATPRPGTCSGSTCTWTIPKNDDPWSTGTKTLQVTAGGSTFIFNGAIVAVPK